MQSVLRIHRLKPAEALLKPDQEVIGIDNFSIALHEEAGTMPGSMLKTPPSFLLTPDP